MHNLSFFIQKFWQFVITIFILILMYLGIELYQFIRIIVASQHLSFLSHNIDLCQHKKCCPRSEP